MAALFLVERADVEVGGNREEFTPVRVRELVDGDHILSHGDVQIPVQVEDEHILRIQLDKVKGDLGAAWCSLNEDDSNLRDYTTRGATGTLSLIGIEDITLLSMSNRESTLCVERHEVPPTATTLVSMLDARRKENNKGE